MNNFYSLRYTGWPPVPNREHNDPNSRHWQTQAQLAQRRLSELLGDDDYELWAEMTWPGDTVDNKTWQELWQDANGAISLGEDALLQELECTCNPAGGNACKVCQANSRIREREEQRA